MVISACLPAVILASTAIYLLGIRGILSLVQSMVIRGELS